MTDKSAPGEPIDVGEQRPPESEAVNAPSASRPESRSGGPGAAPRND